MKITPRPCALRAWISAEHLALLGHAERRRGLVHQDDAGVPVDRPADRHRLPLAAREPPDGRVEPVDVEVELRHRGLGGLGHGAAVDHRQEAEGAPHGLAPEEDVGADRQVVGQGEVLVDGLDALAPRRLRGGEVDARLPSSRISPSSAR